MGTKEIAIQDEQLVKENLDSNIESSFENDFEAEFENFFDDVEEVSIQQRVEELVRSGWKAVKRTVLAATPELILLDNVRTMLSIRLTLSSNIATMQQSNSLSTSDKTLVKTNQLSIPYGQLIKNDTTRSLSYFLDYIKGYEFGEFANGEFIKRMDISSAKRCNITLQQAEITILSKLVSENEEVLGLYGEVIEPKPYKRVINIVVVNKTADGISAKFAERYDKMFD